MTNGLKFSLHFTLCLFVGFVEFTCGHAQTNKHSVDKYLSTEYQVSVKSGTRIENHQVFMSISPDTTSNKKASWVNIPIPKKTVVQITTKQNIISVLIKPTQKNIHYSLKNNTIEVTLTKPEKLSIEVNGNEDHPLYLFADPVEKHPETHSSNSSVNKFKVVYFCAGMHYIGHHYNIESNTTYYLAAGAYLKGDFYAGEEVNHVVIKGRGIIDAGDEKWQHPRDGLRSNIQFVDGRNVRIEGITLINAGNFQFKLQTKAPNTKIEFDGVNMIGWNHNTDGIHISDMDWKDSKQVGNAPNTSLSVKNCFIRANDDGILLCDGVANCNVTNSVFVDDGYGATFCLSWGAHEAMNKVRVSNCFVIQKKLNNPVFRACHAGEANLHNIKFKNIYIDGNIGCLIGLQIKEHRYDPDPEMGSLNSITFQNIYVSGSCKENRILGFDATHTISNVLINNLYINGKKIMNEHDGHFITNEYVEGLQFK